MAQHVGRNCHLPDHTLKGEHHETFPYTVFIITGIAGRTG